MRTRSTITPAAPRASYVPQSDDAPRMTRPPEARFALRVTMLPEARRTTMVPRARRMSRSSLVPRPQRVVRPRRRLGACLVAALLVTATFAAAPTLHADGPPVVVGEVSTSVGHEEVMPVMRSALTTHLTEVKIPSGKKFIVSASLTKLETKTEGSQTTTSCVVSLALRDAKDGVLRGVVQGNASMSGAASKKDNDALVAAAIRGATKGVSEVASH